MLKIQKANKICHYYIHLLNKRFKLHVIFFNTDMLKWESDNARSKINLGLKRCLFHTFEALTLSRALDLVV